MNINELLAFTKKNKASDLHLASNHPPTLRINGDITPLRVAPITPDQMLSIIYSIMTEKQRSEYEENLELDFAIHFDETCRFRVNAFNTINGPCAVFREIPNRIMTLEELGLPKVIRNLCYLKKGLILVTGPTGSGKSTTLAAIVDYINTYKSEHILTIEDPVEFVHKSKKSLVNQREIGANTQSFTRALKSALREDPDIILVGELRDLETISLALTAAETGHLVLATLHTSSAAKTIDRLIDVFPENDKPMARTMLGGSLEAVVSQILIKKTDGTGRVAAHEILIATPAARNLIRDNKIPQLTSIMQVGSKIGMQTMKDTIFRLLEENVIDKEGARPALAFGELDDEQENKSGGF